MQVILNQFFHTSPFINFFSDFFFPSAQLAGGCGQKKKQNNTSDGSS